MSKISAHPEAVKWICDGHPAIDVLFEAMTKHIKTDRKIKGFARNVQILIDYRWLTEGKGGQDLETRERLAEKYHVSALHIFRLLPKKT